MNASEYTTHKQVLTSKINTFQQIWQDLTTPFTRQPSHRSFDLFKPMRQWLDRQEIRDRQLAHTLCKVIPTQCPFERNIHLFGHLLLHIPPMCKLNPLYDEVVSLRFRALCYLADECGEDVTAYC